MSVFRFHMPDGSQLPGGATLWFSAAVYADEDLFIPHPNPVIANCDGEFYPIYLDKSKRVEMQLKTPEGEIVIRFDDARELCGPTLNQAARLWQALNADVDAVPCRYPDLRDCLHDWMKARAAPLNGPEQ